MKKKTPKQVAALICVALLVFMYIITFIAACLDTPGSGRLFAACLTATIGLPILLWIVLWFCGLLKDQQPNVTADPEDGNISSGASPSDHPDTSV